MAFLENVEKGKKNDRENQWTMRITFLSDMGIWCLKPQDIYELTFWFANKMRFDSNDILFSILQQQEQYNWIIYYFCRNIHEYNHRRLTKISFLFSVFFSFFQHSIFIMQMNVHIFILNWCWTWLQRKWALTKTKEIKSNTHRLSDSFV